MASFKEAVQQNRLTDSYNQGSPKHPIPERGANGGSIGGVGNEAGIIEGLFDTLQALEENCHYFYVPSSDGKAPFSNAELQQIMRELAYGIYVHDTVPFFSLHFNADLNMYPVIHPAYQNTLVGRVISLLDYYMKGFLNGAFFDEEYLDEWQKTKTQNKEILKAHCIDLHEYCREHLGAKHEYFTVREFIEKAEKVSISEVLNTYLPPPESPLLSDYSGFRSSFRIIAKQNSIKKADNLFHLDADFDVLYTIEPDPIYEEELRKYRAQHGHSPEGYLRLESAYMAMQKQIKKVMPCLPKFRALFEQLKVINFFSYYFKTLKQAHKVPILDVMKANASFACLPLFPHLPIKKVKREKVKIHVGELLQTLTAENRKIVEGFLYQAKEDDEVPGEIIDILAPAFQDELRKKIPLAVSKDLQPSEKHKKLLVDYLKAFPKNHRALPGQHSKLSSRRKVLEFKLKNYTYALDHYTTQKTRAKEEANLRSEKAWSQRRIDETLKSREERKKLIAAPLNSFFSFLDVKKHLLAWGAHLGDFFDRDPHCISEHEYEVSLASFRISLLLQDKSHLEDKKKVMTTSLEHIQNIWKELRKDYPNPKTAKCYVENIPISFEDLSTSTIQVYTEQTEDEQYQNRRIVGGCGLQLNSLPITHDPLGITILKHGVGSPIGKGCESFQPVKLHSQSKNDGFLFKLSFGDFYTSKDAEFAWMSQTLTKDEQLALADQDSYGFSALHHAAKEGSVATIDQLLASPQVEQIINQRAKNNATPLYVAVQHNRLQAVQQLLKSGANPNSATVHGMTPLCSAIHHGLDAIALELLQVPAINVDFALEDGTTALYLAVECGMLSVVVALLKKGANVNSVRKDSSAPLHIAAKKGSKEMCALLATHSQTNINLQLKSGKTALHIAVEYNHPDVVSFFLERGANPALSGWDKETSLHTAILSGNYQAASDIIEHCRTKGQQAEFISLLNQKNSNGLSPLDMALLTREYGVLAKLLAYQAVIADPAQFLTALCRAKVDHLTICKFIDQHAFTVAQLNAAYYEAAKVGHNMMVSMFQIKCKVADFTDKNGWSIVHFGAQYDHINVVQDFLKQNPYDLLKLTKNGMSIAAIAAEHGSCRVLKLMLEACAKKAISLNEQYQGNHLLLAAISGQHLDAVDAIIHHIHNPNVPLDTQGRQATHFAVISGDVEMLELLRTRGARFDIPDSAKMTAIQYAFEYEWKDVIDYFLNRKYEFTLPKNLLFSSKAKNSLNHVKLFQKAGYDILAGHDKTKKTAVFQAVKNGNFEALVFLLEHGASLDTPALSGYTPFLLAAKLGKLDCLQYLLPLISKEKTLGDGRNALHLAASCGHEECVDYLLTQGLNPTATDKNGKTALELAMASSHIHIAMLLSGKKQELEQSKNQVVDALRKYNKEAFFEQVKLLPLNQSLTFEIDGGKLKLPLLHLIYVVCKDEDRRQEILDEFQKLDGVDKLVMCPQGNTQYHLMAKKGQKLNFSQVDPLLKNKNGVTILHLLAASQKPSSRDQLLQAIQRFEAVDVEDENGMTPLLYALAGKSPEKVKILLKAKANANQQSKKRISPLFCAVESGQQAIVQLLLDYGAKVNEPCHITKTTCLMKAIQNEYSDIARCLVNHGANVRKANRDGVYPIHLAIQKGDAALMRLLHAQGASLAVVDSDGETVAHYASRSKNPKIVEYLVEAGISLQKQTEIVKPKLWQKDISEKKGITPLHIAALTANLPMMKVLIKRGANVEALTARGVSTFLSAAWSGNTPAVKFFKNYRIFNKFEHRAQAISAVIKSDSVSQLKTMLSTEFTIDTPLLDGKSALHLAAMYGSLRCLHYLVENGGDLQKPDLQLKKPLELAVKAKKLATVRYLVEETDAFDTTQKSSTGKSYFHEACEEKNAEMAALFITFGASIDSLDSHGNTALHNAVKSECVDLLQLLLACGADIDKKNSAGKLAEELVKPGKFEIRQSLEQYRKAKKVVPPLELGDEDTIIHTAVRLSDAKHLPILAKICDVNKKNKKGILPYQLASVEKNELMKRKLVECGATV